MYDEDYHHPFMEGQAWEHHPQQDGAVIEYAPEPGSGAAKISPATTPPVPEVPAPVKVEKSEKYADQTWEEMKARAVADAKAGKAQWREAVHYYPHPELTHAEYRVLMILADFADSRFPYGDAYPGHAFICRAAGIRQRMLTKHVSALKRKGFIVENRRGNNTGTGVSASYRLSLPEWQDDSAAEEMTGST